MTRAHFKFLAKQQLDGKVGVLFLASLLTFAIVFAALVLMGAVIGVLVATLDELGAIIGVIFAILAYFSLMIIVVPALNIGRVMMIQRIAADPSEKVKATYVFKGFKYFWGAFKVQFFSVLFTWLWALLFVIPAYIKIFSYSQAMYIYAENPDMGALEAISRSKMMMRGRKFDYFSLIILSFYPWMMLAPFTLGILYVWLLPYMELTSINFYNHAKRVPGSPIYGFPSYGEIIPAQAFMPNFGRDAYQDDLTRKDDVVEAPVAEPVAAEPVAAEPVATEPVAAEPVVEEPVVEEPVVEEPVVEEAVAEEAVVEETATEEPVIEEPVIEESIAEETAEPEVQAEDSEKQE